MHKWRAINRVGENENNLDRYEYCDGAEEAAYPWQHGRGWAKTMFLAMIIYLGKETDSRSVCDYWNNETL